MVFHLTNRYPKEGDLVRTVEKTVGVIVDTDYASHVPYGVLILHEDGTNRTWWYPQDELQIVLSDDV